MKTYSNILFQGKLGNCLKRDNGEHDSIRREVETVDDPFVVKLSLGIRYPLSRPFVVELNLCCLEWHDILCRGVEIAGGPFVVKLSLDLDIIHCEVEIQVLYVVGGHDSLRREVETVDDPFIVKFSFELDIFRREVEIYSRANCVVEFNILRREVEIDSD
ncbi:hypothetical protein F3Y22_tig00112217pilonHSYRG00184 [Hibiscus syriacus]|uniref:Uncharacterized protein n=1 Tax=Hibiscus syriacus TaxID=106335 RepID=A0A6A2X4R3_HIBSY|nr:hypothetical protein F3Y22_tig00112217pilonHSYRG00184 [Hibiscus syriacus]